MLPTSLPQDLQDSARTIEVPLCELQYCEYQKEAKLQLVPSEKVHQLLHLLIIMTTIVSPELRESLDTQSL